MTDAGWAEKAAKQCFHTSLPWERAIANRLKAEHARSVRIVKAEIKRVGMDQHMYTVDQKLTILAVLEPLLTALQRGRGGKG